MNPLFEQLLLRLMGTPKRPGQDIQLPNQRGMDPRLRQPEVDVQAAPPAQAPPQPMPNVNNPIANLLNLRKQLP